MNRILAQSLSSVSRFPQRIGSKTSGILNNIGSVVDSSYSRLSPQKTQRMSDYPERSLAPPKMGQQNVKNDERSATRENPSHSNSTLSSLEKIKPIKQTFAESASAARSKLNNVSMRVQDNLEQKKLNLKNIEVTKKIAKASVKVAFFPIVLVVIKLSNLQKRIKNHESTREYQRKRIAQIETKLNSTNPEEVRRIYNQYTSSKGSYGGMVLKDKPDYKVFTKFDEECSNGFRVIANSGPSDHERKARDLRETREQYNQFK